MRANRRHTARILALIPVIFLFAACDPSPQTDPKTPAEPTPASASPASGAPAAPAPADTKHPELGSPAWYEWVETTAGITDGQGHGPDHGSQEWCNAVSFKVYGERPAASDGVIACDQVWMADIDARLRQRP